MDNYFARLSQIDVSAHVEKKGAFSYLSWPFAVAQLRLADPLAIWDVRRFDGLPYLVTEGGCFVEVAVTVQGVTLSQIHPVLDARNKPIAAPSVFDINTSIQRALVKAIALHGLGLSLYAGEDLPVLEAESRKSVTGSTSTGATASAGAKGSVTKLPAAVAEPVGETSAVTASPSSDATLSAAQQTQIRDELIRVGGSLSRLLAYFKVAALAEIPVKDFDRVIRALNRGRRAA